MAGISVTSRINEANGTPGSCLPPLCARNSQRIVNIVGVAGFGVFKPPMSCTAVQEMIITSRITLLVFCGNILTEIFLLHIYFKMAFKSLTFFFVITVLVYSDA